MALEYDDLAGPGGFDELISGGSKRCFLFRVEDLETEQTPEALSAAATSPAALATIADAHVFKTGKRMFEMYATENTQTLKTTVVGGKDSYGLKMEGEFFVPGVDATTLGIGVMSKNDKLIWLMELNNGKFLQIGSSRWPARLTFEFSAGEPESGGLGVTFKIAAFGTTVAIYEAEPQTIPAV
jgi:hypothetical protein